MEVRAIGETFDVILQSDQIAYLLRGGGVWLPKAVVHYSALQVVLLFDEAAISLFDGRFVFVVAAL